MLDDVEWGEYDIDKLFTEVAVSKKLNKTYIDINGAVPIYSSDTTNNGILGYCNYTPSYKVDTITPLYLVFGDHTRTMNVAQESFCVADNVKVLIPKFQGMKSLMYISTVWKKKIPNLGYSRHWSVAKDLTILLPIKNGKVDFDFMESFIAELESERVAELEAYLLATGIKDYELTEREEEALGVFDSLEWRIFNLEELFGKSTRGKRLKSADRILGKLPFVTAGETDEGISAFIGNDTRIFSENTTTIDMFGSAKYRNYKYGGDDHIAVVHTENLSKYASIFITTAIHKSSYTEKFSYSRNFYAKDADELDISLPSKNGQPDYETMDTFISAIQKLIIKDVVLYADRKINTTK